MCKDGRRICLLESMCPRIGWTSAFGQTAKPSPAGATTKVRLVERLRAVTPAVVALDATGGYETVVASALAAAHRPWRLSIQPGPRS